MKKKIFLLIAIMLLLIPTVQAKEVSFDEVAEKFKNTSPLEENILLAGAKPKSTITTTNNQIIISFTDEGKTYETIFTYENGAFSYAFSGSKTDEDASSKATLSDAWIGHLVYSIALAEGYSKDDFKKWLETVGEAEDLTKYGITITNATYSSSSESGSFTYKGYDTFKIDINKFNLGKNTSAPVEPTNKPSENDSYYEAVENPKTNTKAFGLISFAIIGTISCIYIFKKKDVLKKI